MRSDPPLFRAACLLSALVLGAAPESGRAGHPFITDDADTQGTGNWQLELMGERSRHSHTADPGGGPVRQRSRATLLNPVRDGLRLVGELGVRTNPSRNDSFLPGRNGRFAMLGAIYSPTENIDLDIGLRKGLNHAETDTAFLVGATFRW